jgi:hypothetical protein
VKNTKDTEGETKSSTRDKVNGTPVKGQDVIIYHAVRDRPRGGRSDYNTARVMQFLLKRDEERSLRESCTNLRSTWSQEREETQQLYCEENTRQKMENRNDCSKYMKPSILAE